MTSKKSSALRKLEEKRTASRPPIDARAIVSRRQKPVSRPPGGAKSDVEVREEERSLMQQLILPSRTAAPPSNPERAESDSSPAIIDTVSDNMTETISDTVSLSATVSNPVAVSNSDSPKSHDPIPSSPAPLSTEPDSPEIPRPRGRLKSALSGSRQRLTRNDLAALLERYGNSRITPRGAYTAVPWAIDDVLAQYQTPMEQSVYRQLFRLSHGFWNTHCFVGYDALVKRCNSGKSALRIALKGLEQKKHIETIITFNEKVFKGTIYRVFQPSDIKSIAILLPTPNQADTMGDRTGNADTDVLNNTVSLSTTVSHSPAVFSIDTVSDTNTVLLDTVSQSATVPDIKPNKIFNEGVNIDLKTPDPHPHAVPGSVAAVRSTVWGEDRVEGNLALTKTLPKPDQALQHESPDPSNLSDMDEAYIRSRPSPQQVEIFEAQDAWDEILDGSIRPAASKIDEMLGHIRQRGYSGDALMEKFRGCLEKTRRRAKDPVGWMVSALKKGRYP